MALFLGWPEIQSFHNVKKFIRVDPGEWWHKRELLNGFSWVEYRGKCKLHGTSSAVQIHTDGTILCQSRERFITPEDDNYGFAKWVMSQADEWRRICTSAFGAEPTSVILYGEWAGKGVQHGVALSQLPEKIFAVFAARPLNQDGTPMGDFLWVDPEPLQDIVKQHVQGLYVLPWHTNHLVIDWKKTDEELTQVIAPINDWVAQVEQCDPWVKATFGIEGVGEGLVFYPVSGEHGGFESFGNLCFKAKGEAHKNIKTAKPAQVNPETAASITAFAELALTQARLEQGAEKVHIGSIIFDKKNIGRFLKWIAEDVQKETQDELEASGLTWKQVEKAVSEKARKWFLEQC